MKDSCASSLATPESWSRPVYRPRIPAEGQRAYNQRGRQYGFVLFYAFFMIITCSFMIFISLRLIPIGPSYCDFSNSSTGPQQTFSIDKHVAADLTYSEVRAIQLTWDLIIGQGGRIFHAWIVYRVLSNDVVFLMEREQVSHKLFMSVALTSSTFDTVIAYIKILLKGSNWKAAFKVIWILLALLYVVGFPTLVSASSGYINPVLPYVQLTDEWFVPYNQITACFVIFDGTRVGLGDNFIVTGGPSSVSLNGIQISTIGEVGSDYAATNAYIENAQYLVRNASTQDGRFPVSYRFDLVPSNTTIERSFFSNNTIWGETSDDHTPPWTFNASTLPDPGVVPYNSFIELSQGSTTVTGSILHFKDNATCSRNLTDCYDPSTARRTCAYSQPLLPDWNSQAVCFSDSTFIWGICSAMTVFGLALEISWTIIVYGIWLRAKTGSLLLRRGFNLNNTYETAAYLAAFMSEIVSEDDEQISKAMEKVGDICWKVGGLDTGKSPMISMAAQTTPWRARTYLEERLWEDAKAELKRKRQLPHYVLQ